MSVAVYPRLADLLEEQHLTIQDLERRIAERFGIDVDSDGLQRLVERSPLRQADLELAGAAAAALGVGLDDLFTVAALPGTDEAQWQVLDPAESRRLAALLDREAPLTTDEQADLAHLLDRYGQRLHERRMQELARGRGVSVEDVERERAERVAAALRWWEAFDRDPARDETLARTAADLQARWPA
jgi:hypothetical protein